MSTPGEKVGQAPSVAVPKRFSLVSKPGFRSPGLTLTDPTVLSPVSDSALINAYAELDPEDNEYWVEKRLGNQTLATSTGSAGGMGIGYLNGVGYPFAIYGTQLYAWISDALVPYFYAGTVSGVIAGRMSQFVTIPFNNAFFASQGLVWCANGYLWFTNIGPVRDYLNILDLVPNAPWTTAGPASSSVSLCDGCAYLDTVLYVMDQLGNIWGSAAGAIGTWPATTVIEAGGRNDIPVCLAQQLEYIIALKSTSLRCFYDAGAAAQTSGVGSNLAWVEGADANFGCANAGSVQLIDQTLMWVTNNTKGTAQVARMDGLQVKIVSTPPVERLLQLLPMSGFSVNPNLTTNVIYSNAIKRGGHRFYTITILNVRTSHPFTLVYDLDQELWYIWNSPGLPYWSVVGVTGPGQDTTAGVFAQDLVSGALYALDIDQVYPTDSGIPAQVDIYTRNEDMNTRRRKQLNKMMFVNDQVSGGVMQVRKSDDDYRSWSPMRNVSLSVPQPTLTRCGTFTRRALNLRHNVATPFRIKAADCQIDLGTD